MAKAKRTSSKKTGTATRGKGRTAKRARPRAKTAKPRLRKVAARKVAAPRATARTATGRRVVAPKAPAAVPNPVRAIARRIVDLTLNHDDEGSFLLYADTVESIEPGMPPTTGLDAIKQKFAMWRGMVSEQAWQARNTWVDGNTILIEWTGRVTFAATGKQAELNEVAIHEVQNGKIVRERFYYDRSALQP